MPSKCRFFTVLIINKLNDFKLPKVYGSDTPFVRFYYYERRETCLSDATLCIGMCRNLNSTAQKLLSCRRKRFTHALSPFKS